MKEGDPANEWGFLIKKGKKKEKKEISIRGIPKDKYEPTLSLLYAYRGCSFRGEELSSLPEILSEKHVKIESRECVFTIHNAYSQS